MMKRLFAMLFAMVCVMTFAHAQTDFKQQLTALFEEGEHCYLMDDYIQLDACIEQYSKTFSTHRKEFVDSLDVYQAYFLKMLASYFYGLAEDDSCAYYAERNLRMGLDIFNNRVKTKTIQGMHPNAVAMHQELAQLYYLRKRYQEAKTQLDTVYVYFENKLYDDVDSVIPQYYRTLTQLAMCNGRLGNFNLALSQIDLAINKYYVKTKGTDYFEALRRKGKILMLQADSLGSGNYKKAVDCYRRYVTDRFNAIGREMKDMSDSQRGQYWLATHQFLYDCCRLGDLAPEMLYDLALFGKDYLIQRDASRVKWEQVRRSLGKNDCAIEFVQYFGRHDEKRMGCLVLSNGRKPEFVDLFSTDSLLQLRLTPLYNIGAAITTSLSAAKDTLYNDRRLPRLIWTPRLMQAIGRANRVYFSPDGMLHQLAIEYLMPDSNKICYRLSSTRVLAQTHTPPKLERALLCGGVEYDASFVPHDRDNDVVAYRFLSPPTSTIMNLPGTREEVDSIYACRHRSQDALLVGADATDEAVLRLLKQPFDVIHLSTHGYFGGRIGIYNDIKPLLGDASMSKSGLLFAGAANTLSDKDFDEEMFDGVLSAEELSKLNLSKTELVVLSACQTGLGHLTDDGVYGIQRGLKQAGAKAMILSLWSVGDYTCSLLMRYFYQELERQSVKDIQTAFRTARERLMREEKISYQFDTSSLTIRKVIQRFDAPRHINPFIIIDAY